MSSEAARRVGRGTVVSWCGWVLGRALALAALLMLTRSLEAGDLGALLAALAAGVLGAMLATGGLADATARQAAAGGGPGFGRGDVRRAMRRFLVVLPFVLGAVLVIATRSSDEIGTSGVLAALLLAGTQGGTTIAASIFRARNQPGRFALATNLASSGGRALIALAALVGGMSGPAVLWAFAMLNLAIAIGTWRHALRGLPKTSSEASGMGALQLGGVVWSLIGNLDVVVVGLLLGAGPAATYSVSLRVAEFAGQFMVAIGLFFLPEATRLLADRRTAALAGLYRAATRWSALATLPGAGIGFIAAPEIAVVVYPGDVETTTTLLRLLFVGYLVPGLLGVGYAALIALGAYREIRSASLVALPALVLATIAFTEVWGLTGAACATLAGYAILTSWWTYAAVAKLRASPFDVRYVRGVAACAVGLAVAALADLLLARTGTGPVATLAIVAGAGLVTCTAGVLLAGVLSPAEWELLRAVVRRRPPASARGRGRRPAVRS